MIDFELTEDQRLIQEAVADLARTSLRPRLREVEEAGGLPADLRKTMSEMGLHLAGLPESVGGQGLGLFVAALIDEELAFGDAAVPYAMPGPAAFGRALLELGSAEQQLFFLADFAGEGAEDRFGAVAWSEDGPHRDRPGFRTVAVRDGDDYVVRGKKSFCLNAEHADRFVVFAQVDEAAGWNGIAAFVVPRDQRITVGARVRTLGLDAASFADVTFADVRVPESARLAGGADFQASLLRFFLKQGILVAARAVGLSRAAFEVARDYCDTRKAFGKPIGHFQAVAFKLADRLMDVESARWMVWRAAWAWDAGRKDAECLQLSAQAIAHSFEVAMRCGDDAVLLHGGAGFIRDYPVEKMMRDAKQVALTAPTATTLDQLASAIELGRDLDPALVLPTPETQPIFT